MILEMNDCATRSFAKYGGPSLVGQNLLDCHPEPSRSKLQEMLRTGGTNAYTVEKGGVRKLIYQAPWFEEGQYRGLVEVVVVLPEVLPHFDRNG
jgi:DUF438 domain-containing protein